MNVIQHEVEPQSQASSEGTIVRVASQERSGAFIITKRLVQCGFGVLVWPRLLLYWICRSLYGRKAFGASCESIAKVPGMRGVHLRHAFYRKTLDRCGQDSYIGWNSVFSMPEACIARQVYIGRFCSIGYADIGANVMLADGVQILSGGREHGQPTQSGGTMQAESQTYSQVRIGDGTWVGAGAIIMADVGENVVIGAGAVVNKPIPDGAVAVGVPARVVGTNAHPAPSST